MNDAVGVIEREVGPSWERPNWPVEELDDLNLGLDPTQATIETVKKVSARKPLPRVLHPTRSAAPPKIRSAQ